MPARVAKKQHPRVAKKQHLCSILIYTAAVMNSDMIFLQDQVHVLRNQFQYLNNDIFLQNFQYRQLNVANWQRQENWSISPKYVKFSSLVSSAWYFGHASIKLKTLAQKNVEKHNSLGKSTKRYVDLKFCCFWATRGTNGLNKKKTRQRVNSKSCKVQQPLKKALLNSMPN